MASWEQINLQTFLGALATLFNVWGWIHYLTKLIKGKPNTSWESWLYSLLTLVFATFSHLLLSKSLANTMPYLAGILAVLATTFIAARQNPHPIRLGKLAVWVATASTGALLLPASLINIVVCILYLFAYSGFVHNLRSGGDEPAKPWWLWALSSLFVVWTTYTNENASFLAYLLPATNLICYIRILTNLPKT